MVSDAITENVKKLVVCNYLERKGWKSEMPVRTKMNPADRAKQFMPFSALKGFEEALREKEKIVVEKICLSEERKEELDRKLQQIQKNDIVMVVYFCKGEYIQVTGMVARLDLNAKIIKIVNTKIPFEDIYDMKSSDLV